MGSSRSWANTGIDDPEKTRSELERPERNTVMHRLYRTYVRSRQMGLCQMGLCQMGLRQMGLRQMESRPATGSVGAHEIQVLSEIAGA